MSSLRVLFVCTGNICRSPSAEYLLRARLEERLGMDAKRFEIASAGLGTPGGWEIDPTVDHLLRQSGITGQATFRSRPVDAQVLREAELILTGTKQHRLTIGGDFPEAYGRTFTMREAAALLGRGAGTGIVEHDVLHRARSLIALLQRERGTRALPDNELDILDPYRQRKRAYHQMFEQVRGVVDVLTFRLAPNSLTFQRPAG